MKITKKTQDWIKRNRPFILELLNGRLEDYINALIYEEDDEHSKVIKMWIRELKSDIKTVNNICTLKDKKKKKNEPDFTGV